MMLDPVLAASVIVANRTRRNPESDILAGA